LFQRKGFAEQLLGSWFIPPPRPFSPSIRSNLPGSSGRSPRASLDVVDVRRLESLLEERLDTVQQLESQVDAIVERDLLGRGDSAGVVSRDQLLDVLGPLGWRTNAAVGAEDLTH